MKKVGTLVLCAVAITAAASWKVAPVQAFPEFKKEFDKKYIKDPPTTPDEIALEAAVKTAKCGVCHTAPEKEPTSKKVRNTYGRAISKMIPAGTDKKALKKEPEKIQELLDKAAAEHSDAKDPASPTFGDLIKEGKLPGKDVPADEAK